MLDGLIKPAINKLLFHCLYFSKNTLIYTLIVVSSEYYISQRACTNAVLGVFHKLHLQDLAFFDHLPPSVYIFYGIKVYKKAIFLTTYPTPLVNVVCERSLRDCSAASRIMQPKKENQRIK